MSRRRTLRESLAATQDNSAPMADSFEAETAVDGDTNNSRRGILVRVSPALWRELKLAAVDRGTTVQDLMLESINAMLVKSNHPPIA
jgi:hypothetical protein